MRSESSFYCDLQVTDPHFTARLFVKDAAKTTAFAVAHALTAHTKACKQQLLPSATTEWPNSLDLAVAQLSTEQDLLGNLLRDPGQAICLGTASSPDILAGQLVQKQKFPHETLSPQLRLRARLHFEALRVLDWCFLVIQDDSIDC